MTSAEVESIRQLASHVRLACETLAAAWRGSDEFGFFPDFPEGQCRQAAELLGQTIYDRIGPLPMTIAWGWLGDVTHAWLETDTLVIDITADQQQLGSRQPAVMVVDGSDWHSRFKEVQREPFEPLDASEHDDGFFRLYAAVSSWLDQNTDRKV